MSDPGKSLAAASPKRAASGKESSSGGDGENIPEHMHRHRYRLSMRGKCLNFLSCKSKSVFLMRFRHFGIVVLFVLVYAALSLPPATAQAQHVESVGIHYSGFQVASGEFGAFEPYLGAATTARVALGGVSLALSGTYVPERDVKPGWFMGGVALPLSLVAREQGGVHLQLEAGFHHMLADRRTALMHDCAQQERCMFEAAGYQTGGSFYGAAALEVHIRLYRRISVCADAGLMRLQSGKNASEVMRRWSAGLSYAF